MFDEIIKRAEKAANDMGKKVDIRMDELEVKLDRISVDLGEIKNMIRKLE